MSDSEKEILSQNDAAIVELFGQEYNPESYAICGSDLMIKGEEVDNVVFGDTLGTGIDRDLSSFSGLILERLFQNLLASTGEYNVIGNYWERGNKNEIDIVAVNDFDKMVMVTEVKLDASKARMNKLKEKAVKLEQYYSKYSFKYQVLGLDDLGE